MLNFKKWTAIFSAIAISFSSLISFFCQCRNTCLSSGHYRHNGGRLLIGDVNKKSVNGIDTFANSPVTLSYYKPDAGVTKITQTTSASEEPILEGLTPC